MKVALITGITGQDGSYLAEFLLAKGYEVHGVRRDANRANKELGWQSKISLDELAEDMVLKDLKLAENEKFLLNKGR